MDDQPTDTAGRAENTERRGAPRWVKGLAALGAGLLLLVVALHLSGQVPNHAFGRSDGHAEPMVAGRAGPP
jgi:hypothetical protein